MGFVIVAYFIAGIFQNFAAARTNTIYIYVAAVLGLFLAWLLGF